MRIPIWDFKQTTTLSWISLCKMNFILWYSKFHSRKSVILWPENPVTIVYLEYCVAWRAIKGRPKKRYIFRKPESFNPGLENKCPVWDFFLCFSTFSPGKSWSNSLQCVMPVWLYDFPFWNLNRNLMKSYNVRLESIFQINQHSNFYLTVVSL
jgi:hypothetical protein